MRSCTESTWFKLITGFLVGLLICGPSQALARAIPPITNLCVSSVPDSPGTAEYVSVQCTVHQSLFGDGTGSGLVFGLERGIPSPGS